VSAFIYCPESPLVAKESVISASPDSRSARLSKEVERCFVEFRDPVLRYLLTLGCRHSVAEEIAQEVFLRLHQTLKGAIAVNDARAWLFRVARNLWIDNWREHRRYSAPARDEDRQPDWTHRDSAPDPEQQAIAGEHLRLIEEEVRRLPELQRRCMRLRAEGLRYREIAATLGIPLTAAVDSVRRAVKRLGRLFDDHSGAL
jgi:RNA polymerase sigma-70 factor, ECF subfamily